MQNTNTINLAKRNTVSVFENEAVMKQAEIILQLLALLLTTVAFYRVKEQFGFDAPTSKLLFVAVAIFVLSAGIRFGGQR